MSYLANSLSRGEKIEHEFEQHWILWMQVYAVMVFSFLAAVLTYWLGKEFGIQSHVYKITTLIVFVVGLLVAYILHVILNARDHGVTNKRVVFKEGLISLTTEEINLEALETVEIKQSIMGRILGYGNVEITGRGSSVTVFKALKNPLNVKRSIENAASKAKSAENKKD